MNNLDFYNTGDVTKQNYGDDIVEINYVRNVTTSASKNVEKKLRSPILQFGDNIIIMLSSMH